MVCITLSQGCENGTNRHDQDMNDFTRLTELMENAKHIVHVKIVRQPSIAWSDISKVEYNSCFEVLNSYKGDLQPTHIAAFKCMVPQYPEVHPAFPEISIGMEMILFLSGEDYGQTKCSDNDTWSTVYELYGNEEGVRIYDTEIENILVDALKNME